MAINAALIVINATLIRLMRKKFREKSTSKSRLSRRWKGVSFLGGFVITGKLGESFLDCFRGLGKGHVHVD